jgi:large subunit ribosomal protein L17
MLANMATSLIMHKRITTTLAKAKALRSYVEPLITKSKNDTTHSRRVVFSYLQDKEAITELFREVSVKVGDRPGGYTRIIKLGTRQGDNAEMAMIELVDYNEHLLAEKAAKKSKSTRRRRGGKKKTAEAANAEVEQKQETAVEEKAAEQPAEVEEKEVKEEKTEKEEMPKAEDTHQEDSKEEAKEEKTDNEEDEK